MDFTNNTPGAPGAITAQQIKDEAERLIKRLQQQQQQNEPLIIKTANDWIENAKTKPIPRMLFSEFWHEGEACILFADTNVGKSILAMQIAESIASGIPVDGFKLEAPAQPVLYIDFELSDKQIHSRYSDNYTNEYRFSNNLLRAERDMFSSIPRGTNLQEYLDAMLERVIVEQNVRVLIVDNLTYLQPETEKTKEAWELMDNFKRLRSTYNISILALAHTPKRDPGRPLSADHIQGSKNMANFCDSSFSIGMSGKDPSLRYIKQIKQRSTAQLFGYDRVCTCTIEKVNSFLGFRFKYFGTEGEHLKQLTDEEKQALENQVLELHKNGLSLRDIGKTLNINYMRADRIIKRNAA